jgi:aspartyl-tRNA(Asn)/glutamyl-tRNA(Gln) amidotransferase subunit B
MEEDVAKLVHETEGHKKISLVDFNRAGAPLVEIVTEPDMRCPHDAMEFLKALRTQIRYAGTAECGMESGTMRCDANISLRPVGTDEMNTKVEVKNMNSVRAVGNAIAHEIGRQTEMLDAGKEIVLHTRLWDPDKNVTTPMRGKFSGPCVPDPSVPAIVISREWLAEMRARLPEMPVKKRARFVEQYGLTDEEAALMSAEREVAEYFEAVAGESVSPRMAAQWIASRLLPALKEQNQTLADTPVTPDRFAGLLRMVEREEINSEAGREVLGLLFQTDKSPAQIVTEHDFRQIADSDSLETMVEEVLASHPSATLDYRNGKKQAAGFLIGQIMRVSKGKANPRVLREIMEAKLG